jgi:hypothetical protein
MTLHLMHGIYLPGAIKSPTDTTVKGLETLIVASLIDEPKYIAGDPKDPLIP